MIFPILFCLLVGILVPDQIINGLAGAIIWLISGILIALPVYQPLPHCEKVSKEAVNACGRTQNEGSVGEWW